MVLGTPIGLIALWVHPPTPEASNHNHFIVIIRSLGLV